MRELLKPPTVSLAILNFFRNQPDFPALAGDMSEEFQQRLQNSGPKAARRWFRRDAFRNALALTWRELMRSPIRNTLMALGCIVAVNAATALYTFMRWEFFQSNAEDFLFNQNQRNILLVLLLNLIPSFAVGWLGARLLPRREWALALMFAVVSVACVLIGSWCLYFVARSLSSYVLVGYVISGNLSRYVFFWLGCLWTRRSSAETLSCETY